MDNRVLILDGETRTALAVTRSLGRHDVSVTVGAASRPCLAGCSRYCSDSVVYPPPREVPSEFVGWLRERLSENRFDLVIPVTDVTTAVLSRVRDSLPASATAALPPEASLETVLDKASLAKLAREYGIAAPRTWMRPEQVSSFPVVVKSRRSFEMIDGRWVEGVIRSAHGPDELDREFAAVDCLTPNPIIQEYVSGWGEGLFVLCNHGRLRAVFAHRRIRETPPSGGVSTLREGIPTDPGLLSAAALLLEKLEWHGPAMFEFRVDSLKREPKLLEVNPRFWGSLHLALVSGQDFPWLLYRMLRDGDVAGSFDYRTGVRSRWLLGDLNRLLLVFVGRKIGGKCWRAEVCGFIKGGGRTYLEIESLSDIRPAVLEYREYASTTLAAILRRFGYRSNEK